MTIAPSLDKTNNICVAVELYQNNQNAQAAAGFLAIAETTINSLADTPQAKALEGLAKAINPTGVLAADAANKIREMVGSQSLIKDANWMANYLDQKVCNKPLTHK
jgi:hypothetical protein